MASSFAEIERVGRLVKRTALIGKRFMALRGVLVDPRALPLLDRGLELVGQLVEQAQALPVLGGWSAALPKLERLVSEAEELAVRLEGYRVS